MPRPESCLEELPGPQHARLKREKALASFGAAAFVRRGFLLPRPRGLGVNAEKEYAVGSLEALASTEHHGLRGTVGQLARRVFVEMPVDDHVPLPRVSGERDTLAHGVEDEETARLGLKRGEVAGD